MSEDDVKALEAARDADLKAWQAEDDLRTLEYLRHAAVTPMRYFTGGVWVVGHIPHKYFLPPDGAGTAGPLAASKLADELRRRGHIVLDAQGEPCALTGRPPARPAQDPFRPAPDRETTVTH